MNLKTEETANNATQMMSVWVANVGGKQFRLVKVTGRVTPKLLKKPEWSSSHLSAWLRGLGYSAQIEKPKGDEIITIAYKHMAYSTSKSKIINWAERTAVKRLENAIAASIEAEKVLVEVSKMKHALGMEE